MHIKQLLYCIKERSLGKKLLQKQLLHGASFSKPYLSFFSFNPTYEPKPTFH